MNITFRYFILSLYFLANTHVPLLQDFRFNWTKIQLIHVQMTILYALTFVAQTCATNMCKEIASDLPLV